MTDETVIKWSIEIHDVNPSDNSQYLNQATGGRLVLCQPESTRKLQEIVSNVANIANVCHGQGSVLSVELEDLNNLSVICEPMTAIITLSGSNAAQMIDDAKTQLMEMTEYEQKA